MQNSTKIFTSALMALTLGFLSACSDQEASNNDMSPAPEATVDSETAPVPRASRDIRREQRRQEARDAAIADARLNATSLAFVNYSIELNRQTPLACLEFSLPLNPDTDYSVYLKTPRQTSITTTVDSEKLCIGGLEFGTETKILLREGLPDLDGTRVLATDEHVRVAFDDRPAYVGFAGNGIILPRTAADGLAVETVNVETVNIEINHVTDRSLVFKRLTKGVTVAPDRYAYMGRREDPSDLETTIWSGTMNTTGSVNAMTTTVFPIQSVLGDLKPGAYYIRVEDAKSEPRNSYRRGVARSERWILVTDLALTAYRSDAALDVVARSLQDGGVIQGAKTFLLAQNNEILSEGETSLDGLISFDGTLLKGKNTLQPAMVISYGANGDIAVLDLRRAPVDLSEELPQARKPNTPIDSFLYPERGIYRPGESVYLTGLLRGRDGNARLQEKGHLVIYRPNGVEALRQRFDSSANGGAVSLSYDLPKGSARGVWRASIFTDRNDDPAGTTQFSVEDFIPQRIKVDLSQTAEKPLRKGETTLVNADVNFLYGAPGTGLTVKAEGRLEIAPNPFPNLNGFVFGDPKENFRERYLSFNDRTADGAGKVEFEVGAGSRADKDHRPLRLNLNVSAIEPGGRAVSESIRIPYNPRTRYIGIKPDKNSLQDRETPANFDVALVDSEGVITSGRLKWELLRINHNYNWYRENGRWQYTRSRSAKIVNSGAIKVSDNIAQLSLDHDWGWGNYALKVSGPRGSKAQFGFWIGWQDSGSDDGVDAPDRVQISTDDAAAIPGREVTLRFKSPFKGEAQIVVATDRVISITNRKVGAGVETLRLPVSANWGEGAYVMVNVYSKRDPIKDPRPRRAVGVHYIPVDASSRIFEVDLNAPTRATPRTEIDISVRVKDGPSRESVYMTLAAVDEGILRITKFQTPNPLKHYLSPKTLGVNLLDDYGRLLNPNLGLPSEIRSGGDQLGGEGLTAVPTKSVALFSGVVTLKNGQAKIPLSIPDFNGDLRLMAVVWSETGLGQAKHNITVRDKAPSRLILPRFMAPGDIATATLSIDNIDLSDGEFIANVSADGNGGVKVGNADVVRELARGQRGDETVQISSDGLGVSTLTMRVQGPDNFAVRQDYQIETRTAFLPVTRLETKYLANGKTITLDQNLTKGLRPETVTAELAFSSLPIDEAALFKALSKYPYGCTEQTVSRAAPLVYAKNSLDSGEAKTLNPEVQKAITTLLNRQGRNGAIHMWRAGDNLSSPWLAAYTLDFLSRARKHGYVVPQESFKAALNSLQPIADGDQWRISGYNAELSSSLWYGDSTDKLLDRASTYALYVLAKEGRADASRMRYLHDRRLNDIKSPLAQAHLGTALAIIGDRVRAESAFAAAVNNLNYDNQGDYYQTPLRDIAGMLALSVEAGMVDTTEVLNDQLTNNIKDPQNLSTQEKAFLLFALGALKNDTAGLTVRADGYDDIAKNQTRFALTRAHFEAKTEFSLAEGGQAFATILVTGIPETAPAPAQEQLSIAKSYFTLTGQKVDVSSVTQGELLVVELVIKPQQKRPNPLIVADLLPAGFEIEGLLGPADGKTKYGDDGVLAWIGQIDRTQTKQAQDDRFIAAIDVFNEPVRIAYMVRAVTQGDFTLPGAFAEDMYRANVFARSAATRITITPKSAGAGGTK